MGDILANSYQKPIYWHFWNYQHLIDIKKYNFEIIDNIGKCLKFYHTRNCDKIHSGSVLIFLYRVNDIAPSSSFYKTLSQNWIFLLQFVMRLWSSFLDFHDFLKPNFWNLVELPKFGYNSEIWLKFQNLVEILKFGWYSKMCSKFQRLVKIQKFAKTWKISQNYDGKFMSRSLIPQIEVYYCI